MSPKSDTCVSPVQIKDPSWRRWSEETRRWSLEGVGAEGTKAGAAAGVQAGTPSVPWTRVLCSVRALVKAAIVRRGGLLHQFWTLIGVLRAWRVLIRVPRCRSGVQARTDATRPHKSPLFTHSTIHGFSKYLFRTSPCPSTASEKATRVSACAPARIMVMEGLCPLII